MAGMLYVIVAVTVSPGEQAPGENETFAADKPTPGAPSTAAAAASPALLVTAMVRAASRAAWVTEIWRL
jgi:hypothetical protein